ncbi:MAG: hypothetical protein IT342_21215 [Candidatus Melainabacteria bacterium]|nr:hypothetical protein [Candidatus Melainabacteria bacterium]
MNVLWPATRRLQNGTGNGAFELPWRDQGAFRALGNSHNTNTAFDLPALNINGADNIANNRTGSPHIIQLPGGGTKDLRLADEPDEGAGRGRRLSDAEYKAKLREVDAIDMKIKKSHRTNRSNDV